MDLDSRLANLSLGEIASLLSPKQQEVLLASISVAASLIQQIQQEDSLQQLANSASGNQTANHFNSNTQQQILNSSSNNNNNNNNLHHHHHNNSNNNNNHHRTEIEDSIHPFNASNHTLRQHLHNQTSDSFLDDDQQDEDFEDQDHFTDTEDSIDDDQQQDDLQHHHHHHNPNNSRQASNRHRHQQQQRQTETLEEADEKDLLTIRQFADELKQRRKSIRLSQKGAAQSLRAFTNGVQPCTDAIIYHFENLQLEPDRAMQLIPMLTDWLDWAEKHRFNGKQLPMMSAVTKVPRERKRKVVLFNEKAKQYLEDAFSKNNHPDRYQLDVISQVLSIPTRSIRKWFTNRRQRKRFAEKFSPIS